MSRKCPSFLASTLVSALLRPNFQTHCSSPRSQLKINGLYMDSYGLRICWTVSNVSSKTTLWKSSSWSLEVQVFGQPHGELTCWTWFAWILQPIILQFQRKGTPRQETLPFPLHFLECHTFLLQITYDCSDLSFVGHLLNYFFFLILWEILVCCHNKKMSSYGSSFWVRLRFYLPCLIWKIQLSRV